MATTSIDDKYKQATKILLDLRAQFEQLEAEGENSSMALQGQISVNVNTLSKLTLELEGLVPQQAQTRRELWRMCVLFIYSLILSLR